MRMQELRPGAFGPAVERLLDERLPTRQRALGVLDGALTGRIWIDDAEAPTRVVVVETGDGTVYGGGDLLAESLVAVLSGVETMSGDLIFGFTGPDDPMREILPPGPYYVGRAIDYTDRVPPADEAEATSADLPDDLVLSDIDAALLPRIEWSDGTLHAFGSAQRWSELGVGRALLASGRVVAQAQAGPRTRGLLEMGVVTHVDHRGRGHGTLLSQLVARACEATGDRVWWNTSEDNLASRAIARRLGFSRERAYDLVAYRTDGWQGGT